MQESLNDVLSCVCSIRLIITSALFHWYPYGFHKIYSKFSFTLKSWCGIENCNKVELDKILVVSEGY